MTHAIGGCPFYDNYYIRAKSTSHMKTTNTPIISTTTPIKDCKLFIFDFDNTLYYGHRFALRLVLANLFHALRCKAERKVRHTLAGQDFTTGEALRQQIALHLAKATNTTPDKAKAWYENRYLPSMTAILSRHYSSRPGAKELLTQLLDSGKTVCVLSDYPNTAERLAAIGITDPRIHTFSAEDMGALKPAPRPFLHLAQTFNASPAETLVIGDRDDTDGAGARAANMNYVIIDKHTPTLPSLL